MQRDGDGSLKDIFATVLGQAKTEQPNEVERPSILVVGNGNVIALQGNVTVGQGDERARQLVLF
jgi:hypothetical protein